MIEYQNKIVTICLLLLVTVTAQSQSEDRRERIEIGAKAGINVANVWDADGQAFQADAKVGFAGGVYAGIPIGKYLGIQPEIMVSQKGLKGSGMLLGFPYSFSKSSTFLDVPIQVQFKPSEFITLVAGPQFSYLLNQSDDYTFGGNSTEQDREFKNENITKNILGLVAGADIIYQNFVLSGRVGWDLQTNHGDGTSSTPRYKNQWIQFTLGVNYN